MIKRPYGNTGKWVSEIGFGGWQLGNQRDWEPMEDAAAISLVHEALDRGMQFFDTAPNYGQGRSEELLGKALAGKRADAVINTKFGHGADGSTGYDASLIRDSVEQSLKRLRTEYVDSVLLHNPPFEDLDGKHGHYEVLEELRKEGKIIAYGASVDSGTEMLELIHNTNVGVIEVMFNIFYQEPAEAFKIAKEKDIAIIVKIPLDSGWLSGKYTKESRFEGVRKRWSSDIIGKRADLLGKIGFIADQDTTMTMAALRFILAHPEVSTVIPGVRNRAQLIENIAAGDGSMPDDHVRRLRRLWEDEIRHMGLGW
ncbi:aldo/keto reductase [Cohnella endophytica]|uniref:Aldo/keto reductase n=1 Tax=Cohnella endophytica TaxID=2419778 RepID=A0A494X7S2_9BACL|nr:aldo/keto reductase [Cohnella endophytica]RKP46757.1 aldo/keto reductase [Cohnella endophytica]